MLPPKKGLTMEDDQVPVTTDPEGLIGADEHPPIPAEGEGARRRMLASPVWNDIPRSVLTGHGMEATWLRDYPEPCRLYAYSRGYCMSGCKHPGIDISMPEGSELRAIAGGHVYAIRNPGISGSIEVRVRTASRHEHLYNHMSRSVVAEGTNVTAGQLLGYSGTANSPHLHFELRIPNAACTHGMAIVDPESLLAGWRPGDRFRVTDELNLRTGPGTDHDIIALLPAGTTGTITGGPSSANGYTWWQVVTTPGEGWVAGHRIRKA
jgi:hypothetical protein